jgi:hypothetical protein
LINTRDIFCSDIPKNVERLFNDYCALCCAVKAFLDARTIVDERIIKLLSEKST